MERKEEMIIPIEKKILLTVREASSYSGIGINKLHRMANEPDCPFVTHNGVKRLIKREALEAYLKRVSYI